MPAPGATWLVVCPVCVCPDPNGAVYQLSPQLRPGCLPSDLLFPCMLSPGHPGLLHVLCPGVLEGPLVLLQEPLWVQTPQLWLPRAPLSRALGSSEYPPRRLAGNVE